MSEERTDVQKMSAVGHRIWLHMQDKGPYNKRAFKRFLKRTDTLSTTHQSISSWLKKEHPPVYFVNAVVSGLNLSEAEEIELWRLYFHGKSDEDRRASAVNWERAMDIEGEENNSQDKAS